MIDKSHRAIPKITLETLANSFFKDALHYGFRKLDYLRFVNCLLAVIMKNTTKLDVCKKTKIGADRFILPSRVGQLPIDGNEVTLTKLEYQKAMDELERWLPDGVKRQVLCSTATVKNGSNSSSDGLKHSTFAQIMTRHSHQNIGVIAYVDYDSMHRKAELFVHLNEDVEKAKAIRQDAIMMWLAFGIRVLGLRKIYTNTLSTDRNTITMNEEFGFRIEGILQNEIVFENRYYDILRMGLFAK